MEQKHNTMKIIVGASMVIAIIAIVSAGFFWMKWRQADNNNPAKTAQREIDSTLERVGRLMFLPEGAQPTVATIKDPEQLKDQQFFINAEVGDKLLIYSAARKAILYRPSEDKIIEVAPLNIGE
jgi:hypothetical protein